MKKNILLFIFLLLSSLTASAYDVYIDGIYYNLITKVKQAKVTSGDAKYMGSVTIPATITYNNVTYNVTSIIDNAFYNCSGMTSVTIPNSVTSIGSYAFEFCKGLTSVTIPNSVTEIGINAFDGCKDLTSITISNSMTKIRDHVFANCSGLTSVTIPNSVTSIGVGAFYNCSGLTSVTIPNSVTDLGVWAFAECFGLTSVTIPNSVTDLGESIFYNCSGLTSVTIPSSVTAIGIDAFSGCSGLTSVTIPNSVTFIGESAFYNCSSMTSVTISNSVTAIGSWAFRDCSKLTSVTIPNSVTVIGDHAFDGCSKLTFISIGSRVEHIYNSAFANCSELADIYCYVEKVPSINSDAFDGSYIEYATLYVPDGCVETYKNTAPWSNFGTINILPNVITIDEINFPDENFRNWVLNQSYGKDGMLTDEEIEKVSNISVSNKDIQSLKGIEYFTALTRLFCGSNQITSLDLSNNTALTTLSCYRNQLTTLDVSKNTALTNITCYKNNLEGESMDAFIESLPTVSSGTMQILYNDDDGNVMTTTQVARAKVKGWNVKCTNNGSTWQDYAGIEPTLRGDANGDGEIGMPDVMFVVNYILGSPAETFNEEAADANHDGEIGMPDVMFIVNYILNGKFPDEE